MVAGDVAVGGVAGAADRGLRRWRPQVPGDHAALGEGAGLVGGQGGDGAEGLHRGQLADEGVACGHPACAQCQAQRHDGGQGLGDGGDDQADGGDHHQFHRLAADQSQGQDHRRQQHGDAGQEPADSHQAALQRGQPCCLDHQGGDAAARAGRSGGGDLRPAAPAQHDGAGRDRRVDALVHRHRLARQRRLVDEQCRRLVHFGVGGDDVALGQDQQVSHHDVAGGDLLLAAVADHACLRAGELCQGRDGAVGPDLLHHSDGGVDHDHQHDHGRVGPVTRRDGQHRRDEQDDDERVA
ncbi:hypothetical protein GCM10020220_093560 [Nonomuraea rubra]